MHDAWYQITLCMVLVVWRHIGHVDLLIGRVFHMVPLFYYDVLVTT